MKINTYTYPKHFVSEHGIKIPSCLGLGILDFDSIIEIDNEILWANYYEQENKMLTENLVYKVAIGKDETTIYRYFKGNKYNESSDKILDMAFFKSMNFKRGVSGRQFVTDDKPLFQFAQDIMSLGVNSHLYRASRYFFFPAGLLVKLVKPLTDNEVRASWIRFADTYSSSLENDNNSILPSDHSPFNSIKYDGTAIVFPVFLKDAIALIKRENLLGDNMNTALQAYYVDHG